MANHKPEANAQVRIRHSPAACQGRDASEEVCEPPPPEPSRFELIAGSQGIVKGAEGSSRGNYIFHGALLRNQWQLCFGGPTFQCMHGAVHPTAGLRCPACRFIWKSFKLM